MALLFAMLVSACADKNPVLNIEGGKVQGVKTESENVTVFRGIPYAAPPVGELRWRAPQPVVPWKGVLKADTFGNAAVSPGQEPGSFYEKEFYWEGNPPMSEDCLYLNVWAPTSTLGKADAALPVAMWIHGGAYINGYGHEVTMDGEAWARRGVILVTINYRLGGLGFFSHPLLSEREDGTSGNYGMQDQVAALKWIYDNIAQFGGDPGNITVFGQSAGAMSVKTLLASPMAKDMIAKAIIQSGGGLGNAPAPADPAQMQQRYDAMGQAMMERQGYTTLQQMLDIPATDIIRMVSRMGPHIDGKVMTKDFNQAVYDNTLANVPVMIGSTAQDMGSLGAQLQTFAEVRDSLGCPPVYRYLFARNPPGDDDDPATDPGAFHSSELWYIFGTLSKSWRPFTEADYKLAEQMIDAWTSFAATGNPGWKASTAAEPVLKIFDIEK